MHQIAGWWDSFELWVAGLPFIPQFLVVLVGMVPVSFAIAYLLDRTLRALLRVIDRKHGPEPTLPAVPDTVPADLAAAEARRTVRSGAH
ncbi:hypothetical protein [Nocardia tenerifensis]|uniref:hypothetical protein n=1 Tax=Nocardia tenerifensis TaxID=228006 RepID=UPI000A029E49|nr:hypothetical protein [Nocardia tenerifensis]